MTQRRPSFLFLQGLACPFFTRIAEQLVANGARVAGVNLCFGDTLFWKGPNTVNYRGSLEAWPAFVSAYMDRHQITDIILLGEQRKYHREAIAAAMARDIRVVTTDLGYLRPDWITFELDGMSGSSRFPRDPGTLESIAADLPPVDLTPLYQDNFWQMARWDMLYHFSNLFLWFLFPRYQRPYVRYHPLVHYPAIGMRLLLAKRNNRRAQKQIDKLREMDGRCFVFPLQLEFDAQILSYSPYDTFRDAVTEVLSSFARNSGGNDHLVVKIHPLDPNFKRWGKRIAEHAKKLKIASRVHFFDGGSLDDMIRLSAGMVIVNSTSGIRALQLGCPVKTLGDAIYDIPGLTHQGRLDSFWESPSKAEPGLVKAFIRTLTATILIRGGFYQEPGLDAAVEEASYRLLNEKVNAVL